MRKTFLTLALVAAPVLAIAQQPAGHQTARAASAATDTLKSKTAVRRAHRKTTAMARRAPKSKSAMPDSTVQPN